MEFTRNLKRYKVGDDVKYVKDRLVELGYLAKSTHNIYGNDTYKAVKTFQLANNLESDGIVGILTWTALFSKKEEVEDEDDTVDIVLPLELPAHIGQAAKSAIAPELATVCKLRQDICLEALNQCIDPNNNPKRMRSFYIRGGNLYNKDLTPNVMTSSKLAKYFKNSSYAPYFDGGRQQIMEKQAKESNYTITGADCSGGIVGLWRKFKVVDSGFDANANSLYNTYCVNTKNPHPGDLVWKSGHIGLYVGADYVVEWAGGAYGCQLSHFKGKRKIYDFVKKKIVTMSSWQYAGDPKKY